MVPYILECCIDSAESAIAAQAGGATRLELCSALVIGGLSPSLALFHVVKKQCSLPIRVLLRPRFGDFLYSNFEKQIILHEIALFRDAGADGIVTGALLPDGSLDLAFLGQVLEAAGPLPVTLHRAFDMARDLKTSLQQACSLGIDTILTSGGCNTCLKGKDMLRELLETAKDKVNILIGSGINADTIAAFLADTPARFFHMSGKKVQQSGMVYRNPKVSMGAAALDEYAVWQTDAEEISRACALLKNRYSAER